MASKGKDLPSQISSLQINTSKPKAMRSPVADTWEDEAEDDVNATPTADPDTPTDGTYDLSRPSTNFDPQPPPPTPASPSPHTFSYSSLEQQSSRLPPAQRMLDLSNNGSGTSTPPERRPDKTTATASRLIAAGLGMRAPKRTEEEREYDRTMRDNARKAREKEREEEKRREAEKEKAKAAVWDD